MRIPISESAVGFWYPIGKGYWFVEDYGQDYLYQRDRGHRMSTFKEFKNAFPYESRTNSKHRFKENPKHSFS